MGQINEIKKENFFKKKMTLLSLDKRYLRSAMKKYKTLIWILSMSIDLNSVPYLSFSKCAVAEYYSKNARGRNQIYKC